MTHLEENCSDNAQKLTTNLRFIQNNSLDSLKWVRGIFFDTDNSKPFS